MTKTLEIGPPVEGTFGEEFQKFLESPNGFLALPRPDAVQIYAKGMTLILYGYLIPKHHLAEVIDKLGALVANHPVGEFDAVLFTCAAVGRMGLARDEDSMCFTFETVGSQSSMIWEVPWEGVEHVYQTLAMASTYTNTPGERKYDA